MHELLVPGWQWARDFHWSAEEVRQESLLFPLILCGDEIVSIPPALLFLLYLVVAAVFCNLDTHLVCLLAGVVWVSVGRMGFPGGRRYEMCVEESVQNANMTGKKTRTMGLFAWNIKSFRALFYPCSCVVF